jgi:hypothetical protein
MTLNTCEDRNNLPSLGLIFKGYTKDGKDEAFELILTPDDYVLEFEVNGKSDCVIGIGSDNEDSGWTLGQVFLRAYYTVFDRESEAIGFVKSNPDPNVDEINKLSIKSISNKNLDNTATPLAANASVMSNNFPTSVSAMFNNTGSSMFHSNVSATQTIVPPATPIKARTINSIASPTILNQVPETQFTLVNGPLNLFPNNRYNSFLK